MLGRPTLDIRLGAGPQSVWGAHPRRGPIGRTSSSGVWASTGAARSFKALEMASEWFVVPIRRSMTIRSLLSAAATVAVVLVAAPAALGANGTISGTVNSSDPGGPLANMCVTAEGVAGDVLTTTAADGTYTLSVAPGNHLVRFDDCGTSAFETQYYDHSPDQESATTVPVGDGASVSGIDATLVPVPPDDGAPETSISSGPPEPPLTTTDTTVSFEFSSTDDPDATFECSFDGGAFEECSSPQQYPRLVTDPRLGDGPHHFEVRAVDAAGNRDLTPAGYDFDVNSPAPNGEITAGPESETVATRDVSFQFTSDDPDNSEYLCQLDDRGAEPCTSPQPFTGLDNGPHTFILRARIKDGGEADQTPAVHSFYVNVDGPVDDDPPATTITDGPVGTIGTSGTAFSFESDELRSTFECSVDGAAFADCQSPHIVSGLTTGEHTFSVHAIDPAGNVETPDVSRTFTVDTSLDGTPPDTAITSGPTGASAIGENYASFGFASTEAGSTFECSLDGAAFAQCTSPRTYTGLADGDHTFEVRARDSVGNVDGSPASVTFTVDTINVPPDTAAPDTAITAGPDGPIATRSASFEFDVDRDGSSFECKLDNGSWRRCTSPRNYTGLEDGFHVFQVRAVDPAGNRDQSPDSSDFSVDATPPETSFPVVSDNPDGQRIKTTSTQYDFESNEPSATFECRLDAGLWGDCPTPQPLTGLSEGTHTFAVRAKDALDNVDGTPATSGFTVDLTDPQTTLDSGPEGTVSQTTQTFQFHSNEPGFMECRLDDADWDLCDSNSGHEVQGLSQGGHTFEVRATDSAGNPDDTPATRTFTVDSVAPTTTITSGPSGTITTASASFSFTAGEPGSSFQCQMDGSGWGPCTSPQGYSGLAEGSHTFQVRASDELGNQDGSPATRSFTVDLPATTPPPTNPPPTSPPPTGPGTECASAQDKLDSAKAKLKKAKAKLKKAKSAAAKKKVKKAKAAVKKAQAEVVSSC